MLPKFLLDPSNSVLMFRIALRKCPVLGVSKLLSQVWWERECSNLRKWTVFLPILTKTSQETLKCLLTDRKLWLNLIWLCTIGMSLLQLFPAILPVELTRLWTNSSPRKTLLKTPRWKEFISLLTNNRRESPSSRVELSLATRWITISHSRRSWTRFERLPLSSNRRCSKTLRIWSSGRSKRLPSE